MLIRAARTADLPQIKALWNAMIRDTTATFTTVEKTDTELQAMLEARAGAFLVAEHRGTCAGFVTWGPFRAGPGYARTVEHTILTATPKQGTGRILMQAALGQAQAASFHVMIAGISSENPGAVAFHSRLGFAKEGRLSQVGRKDGRWLDLILMSRQLNAP